MLRSFIINRYISKDFLKIILIMTIGFFSLSMIMNLFEEINFFKDIEVGIIIPLYMCVLIVPNIIYNLMPFIVLLSSIGLFLRMIETDEIIAIKASGRSNFSIILVPSFIAFMLGVLLIFGINPITSALVEKYENTKGSYTKDKDYIAAITSNGIWIKEKKDNVISYIRSTNLKDNYLMNVSIYQQDQNHTNISRIEAESANITSMTWVLKNVRKYQKDDNSKTFALAKMKYQSMYDIDKIKKLYSNLDTVSFWSIKNQIQILQDRGYSTNDMRGKYHKTISFPFFLISMVLLAGVFTLGKKYKGNNWGYVFVAIALCIVIYFCNDFSLALGKTDKISIEISVWMPVLIVFIFSTIGLIHVNQK